MVNTERDDLQEYKIKNNKLEEHNNIYYQNEQQMSEQLNAMKIEQKKLEATLEDYYCLLYTSPSPRDRG